MLPNHACTIYFAGAMYLGFSYIHKYIGRKEGKNTCLLACWRTRLDDVSINLRYLEAGIAVLCSASLTFVRACVYLASTRYPPTSCLHCMSHAYIRLQPARFCLPKYLLMYLQPYPLFARLLVRHVHNLHKEIKGENSALPVVSTVTTATTPPPPP